jgi:hypothetical protein
VTKQPLLNEIFSVNEISTQAIDKNQFCLRENYRVPGTNVSDFTLGEGSNGYGVQYEIPANPEDLDRVIETARTGRPYVPPNHRPLVLAITVVLLVFLTSVLAVRRVRRRRA